MGLLLNVFFGKWKDSLSRFRNGATCSIYPTYQEIFFHGLQACFQKGTCSVHVFSVFLFDRHRDNLLECSTHKFLVVYLDGKQIDNILSARSMLHFVGFRVIRFIFAKDDHTNTMSKIQRLSCWKEE